MARGMSKSPVSFLSQMGLIQDCTMELASFQELCSTPQTLYCGFDPTAPSLHVGHLSGFLQLVRFGMHGHYPIALLGGATAQIGDPSGKSSERPLLTTADILSNSNQIQSQLENICNNIPLVDKELPLENRITFTNNLSWFSNFNILDFLRRVGKRFRVSTMLSRDSVASRLNSDAGISFTEFSYQILQGYDFYHLNKEHSCSIQIGGSDQWGNIVSGIELIKRGIDGDRGSSTPTCGITLPLILDPNGKKFGKTEGNAVWLSPQLTSPFAFYQFFIRQPDNLVSDLIKKMTLMDAKEIDEATFYLLPENTLTHNPNGEMDGHAQKQIARHLTLLVHSSNGLKAAETASALLYDTKNSSHLSFDSLDSHTLDSMFENIPSSILVRDSSSQLTILQALVSGNVVSSKKEAMRLISSGGIYLNNNRITEDREISSSDIVNNSLIFRRGKRNYHLVQLSLN